MLIRLFVKLNNCFEDKMHSLEHALFCFPFVFLFKKFIFSTILFLSTRYKCAYICTLVYVAYLVYCIILNMCLRNMHRRVTQCKMIFFLLFFVHINDRFKIHKYICLKKYESCSMKGKYIYDYNQPHTEETGVPRS